MSPTRRKLHRRMNRTAERRRRVQLTLCIAFLISVCIFTMYTNKADVRASCNWAEPTEMIVIPGDTLWSIAATIPGSEHADLRQVIYEIKKLNNISTSKLIPGQVLLVPAELY
jgi:hypothetical protein